MNSGVNENHDKDQSVKYFARAAFSECLKVRLDHLMLNTMKGHYLSVLIFFKIRDISTSTGSRCLMEGGC